jgi:diguanylate cyclase (GGDEF)-like protein
MRNLALELYGGALPDQETYRLRRAARDLYGRAARGPIFYVAASVVLLLTTDEPVTLPPLVWLAPVAYAILGLLRFLNRIPSEDATPDVYRLWRLRQWLVIDCGCLLWSGHLLVVGLLYQSYSLPLIIALFCGIAYGSSICAMFAMDRRHAAIALACLGLPGTAAFALFIPHGIPIAIGLLVHGLYSLLMLDRAHRDYTAQLDTEYALLQAKAETERLVAIDGLTGLANRREYERRFAQAWNMAARARSNLALLVLDLDNFKQLNDRFGHAAGDACLRHFANMLAEHFRRAIDLTARIGGEEFAVILPGLSATEAAILGEEFRANLAMSVCLYRDQPISVTASIGAGAADWDEDPDPLATFARIDQACYEAKKQGRSRLVSA